MNGLTSEELEVILLLFIFISSLSVFQCSNFRFKSHFTQVQMFAAVLTPIFELVEVNFRVFILKVDFSLASCQFLRIPKLPLTCLSASC